MANFSRHGGGYVPGQSPQGGRHGGGYVPRSDAIGYSAPLHQPVSSHGSSEELKKRDAYVQETALSPDAYSSPREQSLVKQNAGALARREIKPTRLANYGNLRHPRNQWRLEYPNAHVKPTFKYDSNEKQRHQDSLGREYKGFADDRYLSPFDGRVKPLIVQTTDDVYKARNSSTYMRTFIRNVSPYMLRVAMWPTNHFNYITEETTPRDYWLAAAKWIPSTAALSIMLLDFTGANGQERNGGNYDVFPYKHYTYPKVARNSAEDHREIEDQYTSQQVSPQSKRALRPRYLCFISEDDSVAILNVDEWVARNPGQPIDYIFIAYTASQFSHDSSEDMEALHTIAKRAAKEAGVSSYWVGCSCMPDEAQMEEDVYRISDVIRGACSLVIAVGRSHRSDLPTTDLQLREWGSRMWTYPEVLLSPGSEIKVYPRSSKDAFIMPKKQFAATVWPDADVSRQLIDHYEGNLLLSRLELVTLALQCLHNRSTSEYLPGDHSYALMGLLRLRPKVDGTDSAMQAFARLSMANDSDMLLERLIATLPKSLDQPWSNMEDAWDSKLWDIYPTCQVAGVGHDDTVIIDGLRGANVRWKSFERVANLTRGSWKRLALQFLEHGAPLFFYIAIILLAMSSATQSVTGQVSGTTVAGAILLVYSLIAILAAPYLVRFLYGGKFWNTQPWIFGFEGYLNIETIERQIFGTNLGRLQWSPYSSPLSRHKPNRHGECIGIDPTTDAETAQLVKDAIHAQPGDLRVFTIVDTGNMEVTMFQAVRPPVAFLLAGEEGGMQRAIGVSYEWETACCYRETVIRMPTPTKSYMARVPRVRFGLKRRMMSVREV